MVSSREVAKKAGVSQATVSRVINGAPNVRPETREKVKRVMKELGYRPNTIARSLVMNKTKTIALVTGNLNNPYYSETTTAIINLANKKGYKVIVYIESDENRQETYELALSQRVDGIVLSSMNLDDPFYDSIVQSGIPFNVFNRKHSKSENFVVLNNRRGGKTAMEHLVQLGHRNIGIIMGPEKYSTFAERMVGCFDVLQEYDITLDESHVKNIEVTKEEIESTVIDLISSNNRPTAIVCGTDHIALIVMDVILSMGLKIPEDISIIGFDDIAIAKHQSIQLTTVAHNVQRMAELAVHYLIKNIEGTLTEQEHRIILEPYLIVRKTTAKIST